jgi:hypothetical protein
MRTLIKFRFWLEVDGSRFYGTVERYPPGGWIRTLSDWRGATYYHAGTVAGGIRSSPAEAFDALIVEVGRIWGVRTDGPWRFQ